MAVLGEAPTQAPPQLNRRDSIAIGFFGTWMATGLYLDGWAHIHERPESFFTPWHGVLYSGFAGAVAFFTLDSELRRRRGEARPLPRLMVFGLVIFLAGAVGDFGWHEIFGIERDLEALLSPTHLALLGGGTLMVTGPFRSAWARTGERTPSWRTFWPALVSITLATAVASFFTMYLSAFNIGGLRSGPGSLGFFEQAHAIASVLTTNAVLLVPTLLVLKRWRPPPQTFVILYGAVGLGMVGMQGLDMPLLIVPALIGGMAADCIGRRHGPLWGGAIVPLAMWSTWFGAVEGTGGVDWPPELVAGTVILATLSGLVLGGLSAGPPPLERGAHLRPSAIGDQVVHREHREAVAASELGEIS